MTQTPQFGLSRESKTREAVWIICLSSGNQGKAPLEAGISDPFPHPLGSSAQEAFLAVSAGTGKLLSCKEIGNV